jgi:hypothetical protein
MNSDKPTYEDAQEYMSLTVLADSPEERAQTAFKFLLNSMGEQRKAIRALDARVKELEGRASGDARYQDMAQGAEGDPTALDVW